MKLLSLMTMTMMMIMVTLTQPVKYCICIPENDPTTISPTSTLTPSTLTPSSQRPSTLMSSSQIPSTLTPSSQTPSTLTPSTQTPSTQIPSTQTSTSLSTVTSTSTLLESTESQSTQLESTQSQSTQIESTQIESTQSQSTQIQSTQIESTQVDTSNQSTQSQSTQIDSSTQVDSSTQSQSTQVDSSTQSQSIQVDTSSQSTQVDTSSQSTSLSPTSSSFSPTPFPPPFSCSEQLSCYNEFFSSPFILIDNVSVVNENITLYSFPVYSMIYVISSFPGTTEPEKQPNITSYININILQESESGVLITPNNSQGIYSAYCIDIFHDSSVGVEYNGTMISILNHNFNATVQNYYNCTGEKTQDIYTDYMLNIIYIVNIQEQQNYNGIDVQCAIWTFMNNAYPINVSNVSIVDPDQQLQCNERQVRVIMQQSIDFLTVNNITDGDQVVCQYGSGVMLSLLLPDFCGPQLITIVNQLDQLNLTCYNNNNNNNNHHHHHQYYHSLISESGNKSTIQRIVIFSIVILCVICTLVFIIAIILFKRRRSKN